jgi:hypothetical protein
VKTTPFAAPAMVIVDAQKGMEVTINFSVI